MANRPALALVMIATSTRAFADGSTDVSAWLHREGFSVQNASKGANTQLPAVVSYQYDDLKAASLYQTDAYLSWSGLESWSTPTGPSLLELGPVFAVESHATTQPSAPQNNLSLSAGAHWDPTWTNMQSVVIKATGMYESNSSKNQSDTGAALDVRPKQLKWTSGDTTIGLGNSLSHFGRSSDHLELYLEPYATAFFGKTLKDSGMSVEAAYHTRLDAGCAFSAIGYPARDTTDFTLRFDGSIDELWLVDAAAGEASTLLSYQLQAGVGFGKLVTLGLQWKDGYAAPSFAETKQIALNLGLKI